MKQALRGLSELNKKEKPNIIAYIADQSTPRKNKEGQKWQSAKNLHIKMPHAPDIL